MSKGRPFLTHAPWGFGGLQLDQSLLEEQGKIYKVEGVDENAPAASVQKKRKQHANGDDVRNTLPTLRTLTVIDVVKDPSAQKPKKARVNTAVYVTSIPLDADAEEISHTFSKCGVIAEEIDSGKARIKMYENDQGQFKGDALIVYFRPESVSLAIQMLDDTDFRLGAQGPMGKMRVQAADFSYKSQQEAPAKSNKKDQKKIIKKTQKLNKSVLIQSAIIFPWS